MADPHAVPPALKSIQPYLLRANELQTRDPVVSYYCRYYAVQKAIQEIGSNKEHNAKNFLLELMDRMEHDKKAMSATEAITEDVVGQAHVESFALKLFDYADSQDRLGKSDKRIARTFHTTSYLFEVSKVFGDLDTEISVKQKYCRYKAVNITKCLNQGITPTPGPPGGDINPDGNIDSGMTQISTGGETDTNIQDISTAYSNGPIGYSGENNTISTGYGGSGGFFPSNIPPSLTSTSYSPEPSSTPTFQPRPHSMNYSQPQVPPTYYQQPPQPQPQRQQSPVPTHQSMPSGSRSGGVINLCGPLRPHPGLTADTYALVSKYSRFCISSLQYEDTESAISNLQKALLLLTTGEEN